MRKFISNPRRDATDAIAGFVYQVQLTIRAWLNLQIDEVLELECGEDLARIRLGADRAEVLRTLEQIKASSSALTLRSSPALESLANFCEHRHANPGCRLRFRYITTSRLTKEKLWARKATAIEVWEQIRQGQFDDAEQTEAVLAIRDFLRGCQRPQGVQPSAWAHFVQTISQGDQDELLEIIQSFEWSTGEAPGSTISEEIKQGLLKSGLAAGPPLAEFLFAKLFLFVFDRLCRRGPKSLTPEELVRLLKQPPPTPEDQAFVLQVCSLRDRVAVLEDQSAKAMAALSQLGGQVKHLASKFGAALEYGSPRVYLESPDLVHPALSRAKVVERVVTELSTKSWASVAGEPGSGKTQLCLLTINQSKFRPVWINLRGLSQEAAVVEIDCALSAAASHPPHLLLKEWYSEAVGQLRPKALIVLDDLPKITPGSPLSLRLEFLRAACERGGSKLLSTTYYDLPRTFVDRNIAGEVRAPRLSDDEVVELLSAHGAPSSLANDKFARFLTSLTEGLPTLVAAVVKFLEASLWTVDSSNLQSLFQGEFASGQKKDARSLVEATVRETDTRELLYRLGCALGPIARIQVEKVARVPPAIRLPLEKIEGLLHVWVQPYGQGSYRLSPLLDKSLAALLDEKTYKGVHACFAVHMLRGKVLGPWEVALCFLHFCEAGLLDQAALILAQVLGQLIELDQPAPTEQLISRLWVSEPLPRSIDINIRLHLRTLQLVLAERRNRDFSFLIADVDRLLEEAGADTNAQLGIFAASGYLAMRFARSQPNLANKYLVLALRGVATATLPDGTRLKPPKGLEIENVLWFTANSARSVEDVSSWLDVIRTLTPEQVRSLSESKLAQDNSVILCDSIWYRELQKPDGEKNWDQAEQLLREVETTANALAFALLRGAAIRGRIVLLAESKGQLQDAVTVATKAVTGTNGEDERFLIEEAIGRQLSYAGRWPEALDWMLRAAGRGAEGFGLLRRNLLITISKGIALSDALKATDYTKEAVEISKRNDLEPLRICEALGEHALSLFYAGRLRESFSAWQEAVGTLLKNLEQRPSSIQTFLGFHHAAGYFSGMAMFGSPPKADYVPPKPGFFLTLYALPVDLYKPVQRMLLLLRTAMFAEAIGDVEAAAKWAELAAENISDGQALHLFRTMAWLLVPAALQHHDYIGVIDATVSKISAELPDENLMKEIAVTSEERERLVKTYDIARQVELSLIFGAVPIAFALATERFKRDISHDLALVTARMRSLTGEAATEWGRTADLVQQIFGESVAWQSFHAETGRYYSEGRIASGILCSLGSILLSPVSQSLGTQISLAKDLENLYRSNRSIRHKTILPFFQAYWRHAIEVESTPFRTSPAYAKKSLEEALSLPVEARLRRLLGAMEFCVNLPLPSELRNWLRDN